MKKGKLDNAKRRALNLFDIWNKTTGFVVEHTGYYYELQSLIEDAVECGAQAALNVYEPLECERVNGGFECGCCGAKGLEPCTDTCIGTAPRGRAWFVSLPTEKEA